MSHVKSKWNVKSSSPVEKYSITARRSHVFEKMRVI